MKPLNKHAQEMLAVIGSYSRKGTGEYWMPCEKTEYVKVAGKSISVFISAPWTTGAIRTLTSIGLVEVPAGAMNKYARRITEKGRDVLEYYDLVNDFI